MPVETPKQHNVKKPTPEEQERFKEVQAELQKKPRRYMISYSDETDKNVTPQEINFNDQTPLSIFIKSQVLELDFRLNRLKEKQAEPVEKKTSAGRLKSRVDIQPVYEAKKTRSYMIEEINYNLKVLSGERIEDQLQPIILHRSDNVITGYHFGKLKSKPNNKG